MSGEDPQFNVGRSKPAIQVASPCGRQPVVQEYFQRPPVRHPAQNKKALLDQTPERAVDQIAAGEMRQHKTSNQDRGADPERTATDPEQLVDFALNGIGMMGEISLECFFQLSRSLRFRPGFGKVESRS